MEKRYPTECLLNSGPCMDGEAWLIQNRELTARELWDSCPELGWRIWGARELFPAMLKGAMIALVEAERAAAAAMDAERAEETGGYTPHPTIATAIGHLLFAAEEAVKDGKYFTAVWHLANAAGAWRGIERPVDYIVDALGTAIFESGAVEDCGYL